MDIRQFALLNKSNPLDVFLSVESNGIVSVWSFLQKRRVTKIATCFDIGGERLAVNETAQCLIAANFNTGEIQCHSLDGHFLWGTKHEEPQFINWISALSSWCISLDSGDSVILEQTGIESMFLNGIERVFPLGANKLIGVTSESISIFDSSLSLKNELKKETFTVLDFDFFCDSVAAIFAGGIVVISNLSKNLYIKCPKLNGLAQVCAFVNEDTLYILNDREGEAREILSYSISESNWRVLLVLPWTAGRGVFAENGKYFLSHHAGIWDIDNATCVWSFIDSDQCVS